MQNTNSFKKAISLFSATLNSVDGLTKSQRKFLDWLLITWLLLPIRHNFLNLSRYGNGKYCEQTIRNHFSKKLPFVKLFEQLFINKKTSEYIAVFDPSHLTKSGKKTYGLGKFWSGTAQQIKKGLEIGCLAMVDVAQTTAYHVEAVQTPSTKEINLIDHYVSIITKNIKTILKHTKYIVVDGYFMKDSFIKAMQKLGLHTITKARTDANLKYIFKGPQKQGKGRPKQFAGKVDVNNIDKRRWKKCFEDNENEVIAYELVVYSVALKMQVKAIYIMHTKSKRFEILISTDTPLAGEKIIEYYRLRFQIEFLIRDAKQHTGLNTCEARSENKLYNHFNMALFSVSFSKQICYNKKEKVAKEPFSMRSVKTYCYNKFIADSIFLNLDIDLKCRKIMRLYLKTINLGKLTA
jgi:Transposase DDE domain